MRARARRARGLTAAVAAALLVPVGVAAQGVVPVGPRFVVEELASERYAPRYLNLALDRDRGGLVAWTMLYGSIGNDSSVSSVQARRLDPDGAPRGAQFQVNAYTTNAQSEAVVSFAADGSAVVVWESTGSFGSDASSDSVQLRRFDATGAPLTLDRQVNVATDLRQDRAALTPDLARAAFAGWRSASGAGPGRSGLRARRLDGLGEPVGSEFQVHQFATGYVDGLDLAPHPDGGVVAVWARRDGDPVSRDGARARRFGPAGVASAPEQAVSTYAPENVRGARIAALADGFAVVWTSFEDDGSGGDGSDDGVRGRLLDVGATPVGAELAINAHTTGRQWLSAVAADGRDGFVVVWRSQGLMANPSHEVFVGGRFGPAGDAVGSPFVVDPRGRPESLDVAPAGDGELLLAWVCGLSLCAQRFGLDDDRVFGDGFETGAPALWSEVVSPAR